MAERRGRLAETERREPADLTAARAQPSRQAVPVELVARVPMARLVPRMRVVQELLQMVVVQVPGALAARMAALLVALVTAALQHQVAAVVAVGRMAAAVVKPLLARLAMAVVQVAAAVRRWRLAITSPTRRAAVCLPPTPVTWTMRAAPVGAARAAPVFPAVPVTLG